VDTEVRVADTEVEVIDTEVKVIGTGEADKHEQAELTELGLPKQFPR
jgi:hypothetical protein